MTTWLKVILIVLAVIALIILLHVLGVFNRVKSYYNDYTNAKVPITNL
jgi:hypothetical protein